MIADINLLPKVEKRQSSPTILYGAIGIVALVSFSVLVWVYFGARSELITLTPLQQQIQAERDQLQIEYDVLTGMNQGSLEESVAFVESVSYAVSPLIDETQNLQPEHTYLRNYEFNETSITVTADFETLTDISTYVNRLEQSPYFIDVQLGSVSNFELNPATKEVPDAQKFDEVPRYSVDITLFMNETYLASGGVR